MIPAFSPTSGWLAGLLLIVPVHGLSGPPPSYRTVFIASTAGTGDLASREETQGMGLSGLEAGDEICQVRAEAAGLASDGSPVFHGWLSTSSTDAYCHV